MLLLLLGMLMLGLLMLGLHKRLLWSQALATRRVLGHTYRWGQQSGRPVRGSAAARNHHHLWQQHTTRSSFEGCLQLHWDTCTTQHSPG